MKTHRIEVSEILSRVVEVPADNDQQALELVRRMYRDCEIVLDASDYSTTKFSVKDENSEW